MATLTVKNRDFQRATGLWLQKARRGDTVVIVSPQGPPLTLKSGRPGPPGQPDWESHFAWLKNQPLLEENPVDELRRGEGRGCRSFPR
jgi:hypothetical protein